MESILAPISIGIDIGKIRDNTAISVAEVVRVETGQFRACKMVPAHMDLKSGQFVPAKDAEPVLRTRYIIQQIGRIALGTSYTKIAEKIVDMLLSPQFERRQIRAYIDVTGVGQAIFDMVRKELHERASGVNGLTLEQRERLKRVMLHPISFVHGQKYNRKLGTVGKSFLVSKMQARLQNDQVDLPNTPEAVATCEELKVFKTTISQDGKDTYGAATGAHDDLAVALCLSCLEDPYSLQVTHSERVY
jgi:hypothetical protein